MGTLGLMETHLAGRENKYVSGGYVDAGIYERRQEDMAGKGLCWHIDGPFLGRRGCGSQVS